MATSTTLEGALRSLAEHFHPHAVTDLTQGQIRFRLLEYADFARHLGAERDRLATLDRTLTLPNGTKVRAGDVLGTEQDDSIALQITGVGNAKALYEFLSYCETENGMEWCVLGETTGREDDPIEAGDWRPWSDVYPDRPVPGKE